MSMMTSFFGWVATYNISAIQPSHLIFNGVGFGLASTILLVSLTMIMRLFYAIYRTGQSNEKVKMFSLFWSMLGFGGLSAKCIGFGFHNEMYNLIFYGCLILMVLTQFREEAYTIKIIGNSNSKKIMDLNRYLNTNMMGLLFQAVGLYALLNSIMPISHIKPFDIKSKTVLLPLLTIGIIGGVISMGAYHAFYNSFNQLFKQRNQRYLNMKRTFGSTLTSVFLCTIGLYGYRHWTHHAHVSAFDLGVTIIASFIIATLLMRYLPTSPCCERTVLPKYDNNIDESETDITDTDLVNDLRKMTSMVEYNSPSVR